MFLTARLSARSKKTALSCCAILVVGGALASNSMFAQQDTPKETNAAVTEAPKGKAFHSPEAAAAALYGVCRRNDEADLLVILGPGAKDLVNWSNDPQEREERRAEFADKYRQMHRLVKEPDGTVALYVGAENWPLPIPIVEYNGKWFFDTDLGKQEVLYRRIGRNETGALAVCTALVDAEKDYYNDAHQYTANFISSNGSHNGLYWQATSTAQKSPIGPYLAHAGVNGASTSDREPYHGYYYKILIAPGTSSAQSGANAGQFSVVAYPAEYRSSGVKTFIMDENGSAYEKDLGSNTTELAAQIASYPPDNSWEKVE